MTRGACLAGVVAALACSSEYPPEAAGHRIKGTVHYAGDAHLAYGRPAIGVYAFATWVPQGPPHGGAIVPLAGHMQEDLSYELRNVPPYTYFVYGELVDLDALDLEPTTAGGYPDYCFLSSGNAANVRVTADEPVARIDFSLYGSTGAEDPCSASLDKCPAPGKASLFVEVQASVAAVDIAPEDMLEVILFGEWPAEHAPIAFKLLPGTGLYFPAKAAITGVPPGNAVVYVCFDKGGDNVRDLCVEGDLWTVYPATGTETFAEATIVNLRVDLDTGLTELVGVDNPSDVGCE